MELHAGGARQTHRGRGVPQTLRVEAGMALRTSSDGERRMLMPDFPPRRPPRVRIENPWPMIDCGRFPVKRTVGDVVEVSADVWSDGHDILRAEVVHRGPDDREWQRTEMRRVDAHED